MGKNMFNNFQILWYMTWSANIFWNVLLISESDWMFVSLAENRLWILILRLTFQPQTHTQDSIIRPETCFQDHGANNKKQLTIWFCLHRIFRSSVSKAYCILKLSLAFRSNNFSELAVSHLSVFLCFCMLILMLLQATHALLALYEFVRQV